MFKRRRKLVIVIAALVVVVVAWAVREVWEAREPTYKGQKLSTLVEAYGFYSTSGIQSSEATAEALREIGTNAIPWLIRWARQKRGSSGPRLSQWIDTVMRPLGISWFANYRRANRIWGARRALAILAPQAPEMVAALYQECKYQVGFTALFKGWPPAAEILVAIGMENPEASAVLITNKSPEVRAAALLLTMHSMVGMKTNPVPLLRQALADRDPLVRLNASVFLKEVSRSSDDQVRAEASNALRQISPEIFTNTPAR